MSDDRYDRLLIILAWVAPLFLLGLNGWQASLDRWYMPAADPAAAAMPTSFDADVATWLDSWGATGKRLYLLAERDCPCTRITIRRLTEALRQADRPSDLLSVVYLEDSDLTDGSPLSRLIGSIPATPTLIVADGPRLLYGGPAISGSFCTGAVQTLPGLSALDSPRDGTLINRLDQGCYCPIEHRV